MHDPDYDYYNDATRRDATTAARAAVRHLPIPRCVSARVSVCVCLCVWYCIHTYIVSVIA